MENERGFIQKLKDYLPSSIRKLLDHPTFKKILKNVGWLSGGRIASMAIGLTTKVVAVRYLGPSRFGNLQYALSLASILSFVAALGLRRVLVRELVEENFPQGELLGTSAVLRVIAGGVLYGGLAAYAELFVEDAALRGLIYVVGLTLLLSPVEVLQIWFRSRIESKLPAISALAQKVCTGLGRVVLVGFAATTAAFAWLNVGAKFVFVILLAVFLWSEAPSSLEFKISGRSAKALLRDSWPLIISGLSIAIYKKIDQVMLGELVGSDEVGVYATAATLSEVWTFLPLFAARSIFPKVVSTKEQGDEELYKKRLQVFYDGLAGIIYVIAIPTLFVADFVVILLFGDEFSPAGPMLRVHIWSMMFFGLGQARDRWLIAENLTKFQMFATITGAVSNVALNYILAPTYGGLGAAWATLISYGIYAYLSTLMLRKTRPAFWKMTKALFLPFRWREAIKVGRIWRNNESSS